MFLYFILWYENYNNTNDYSLQLFLVQSTSETASGNENGNRRLICQQLTTDDEVIITCAGMFKVNLIFKTNCLDHAGKEEKEAVQFPNTNLPTYDYIRHH